MAKNFWKTDPRDALKAGPTFDLSTLDRNGRPGWAGNKSRGEAYMAARGEELSDLQEKLFAEGRSGGERSVLLVLQGLDTAGKGGIVRHVMGMVDPQGVKLASFGVPTAEERAHHYLWRIEKQLPPAGRIGVFDRSHYEDVLVVRVDELVPEAEWQGRYDEINAWEEKLIAGGTTIVKVALMVSYDEQGARLAERLDRPDKYWKFSPSDITTRSKWPAYQQAYADVFARTSTEKAPWYVVPADRKWYARLAVTEILTQTLESLDLGWPAATFDVAEMQAALAKTNQASV
ncbi:polyphosphate kinase 2 family protein [Propioniciclava flava]